MNSKESLNRLSSFPLVAILRGLLPSKAIKTAECLISSGWQCLEVPLNRPCALESIEVIAKHFSNDCIIGAGTVLSKSQVVDVSSAGGQIIVSPNTNEQVIRKTNELNMLSVPGAATATEICSAAEFGADAIKLFPANGLSFAAIKSLTSVACDEIPLIAVGGVTSDNFLAFLESGCAAVGIGGELFKPLFDQKTILENAERFANAYKYYLKETLNS